jgi:hypothetical protein
MLRELKSIRPGLFRQPLATALELAETEVHARSRGTSSELRSITDHTGDKPEVPL